MIANMQISYISPWHPLGIDACVMIESSPGERQCGVVSLQVQVETFMAAWERGYRTDEYRP